MAIANRLQLGPIVGHTDEQSTRIWIRVFDDPLLYTLTVHGVGEFGFASTETKLEFRTAIAIVQGLRANHPYKYTVRRLGRALSGATGWFQTMPPPEYLNELSFVMLSCSHQTEVGAWEKLEQFIEDAQPRFLLMIGDQIYNDSSGAVPDNWETYLEGPSDQRRHSIAEKYQENWSRPYVSRILANIPCYMMWDDHDIRDGWGSFAPDSQTLSDRYPLGQPIHEKYVAFFQDAREVCWHFQMSHNPPPLINGTLLPPPAEIYQLSMTPPYLDSVHPVDAMPFVFRAGRTAILVADGRGQRDIWREERPILGKDQWLFLNAVVDALPAEIDAVIMVTPVPIVSMAPRGQGQLAYGSRTDDVESFKRGDEAALREMFSGDAKGVLDIAGLVAVIGLTAGGVPVNLGQAKLNLVDDVRDQWSHSFSRPEQEALLRLAGRARTSNRTRGNPRGLLFAGGDLHSGGLYQIQMAEPECTFECLISSGIGKSAGVEFPGLLGTFVDEDFDVADGIHATLQYLINNHNFGIVSVIPDRHTAHISAHVAHTGARSDVWGVRLKLEEPRGLKRLRDQYKGVLQIM